jgi:hypothetical protein
MFFGCIAFVAAPMTVSGWCIGIGGVRSSIFSCSNFDTIACAEMADLKK